MFTVVLTLGVSFAIPPAAEAVLGDRLFGLPIRHDGYGDALPDGAIARLGSLRWRVNPNVQGILFSRDGRRCYPIGMTAQAFDYPSGKEIELKNQMGYAQDGQLSADGRYLYLYLSRRGLQFLWRYDLIRNRGNFVRASNSAVDVNRGNNQSTFTFSANGRTALELAFRIFNNQHIHYELRRISLGETLESKKIASWESSQMQNLTTCISASGRYAAIAEVSDFATSVLKTTVRIWDMQSGRSATRVYHNESMVLKARFTPDEDQLLVRYYDKFKSIANPLKEAAGDKAQVPINWKLKGWPVEALAMVNGAPICSEFAIEGSRIIYEDNVGNLILADYPSFRTIWQQHYGNGSGGASLAFTPDGKKIAFTTQGGRVIRFLDRASGKELTPPGHTEGAMRVVFHPTMPLLVSSASSSNVRFWTWQALRADRENHPEAFGFRQSASHLLDDRESPYGTRSGMQFVREGKRLIVPTYGERAFEYDFDGQRRFRLKKLVPPGLNSNPDSMIFSPDGAKFISYDTNAFVASMFNGEGIINPPLQGQLLSHRRYGYSNDSQLAAFAVNPDEVAYLDAKTGAPISPAQRPGERFRHSQRFLIGMDSSLFDNSFAVRMIDLRTAQPWCERYTSQTCYAFSSDGRYVATYEIGTRNSIVVREIASGGIVARFTSRTPTEELNVQDLEFSPDGKLLASAMEDGTILIWNTDPASRRYRLRNPGDDRNWAASLRDPNARIAFSAIGYAVSHPNEAIAYFRSHYVSTPQPEDRVGEELLRQLGEAKFGRRVEAHRQLARLAPLMADWFDGLSRRNFDADIKDWLGKIRRQPLFPRMDADVLFAVRMVECLERIGTPEAKTYLKELAKQGDWAALSARIALERMEK